LLFPLLYRDAIAAPQRDRTHPHATEIASFPPTAPRSGAALCSV
jgi:hypothetical protein